MKGTPPASPVVVAGRYFEAWRRRSPAAIGALFASGGVYIDTSLREELTGDAVTAHAERLLAAIPDVTFEITSELLTGAESLASQWIMTGTCAVALPGLGEVGAPISITGADFIRVCDGEIASVQVYRDPPASSERAGAASGRRGQAGQGDQRGQREPREPREKYEKAGLAPDEVDALAETVRRAVLDQRLYLDADLTLARLAEDVALSTNHLSQVINGALRCNFAEFINRLRIDEAKRLLREQHREYGSVLRVALEAGFRSKSSFYSAFRRHVGMTPREYLAQDAAGPP